MIITFRAEGPYPLLSLLIRSRWTWCLHIGGLHNYNSATSRKPDSIWPMLPRLHFALIFNAFHWFEWIVLIFIRLQWFSLIIIGLQWFTRIFIECQWFSLIFHDVNDFQLLSLIFRFSTILMIFVDYNDCHALFNLFNDSYDSQWCSLNFKDFQRILGKLIWMILRSFNEFSWIWMISCDFNAFHWISMFLMILIVLSWCQCFHGFSMISIEF